MGKIATEQEARSKGTTGNAIPNKGCTKSVAESFRCKVRGNYSESQLVQIEDVDYSHYYCDLIINVSSPNPVILKELNVNFVWEKEGTYVEEVDSPPYTETHYPRFAVSDGRFRLKELYGFSCIGYDSYMEDDAELSMENYEFEEIEDSDRYVLTINVTHK